MPNASPSDPDRAERSTHSHVPISEVSTKPADPAESADPPYTLVQEVYPHFVQGDLLVIPGYEVQREIARGGMGRVLAARDLILNREVALKTLIPGQVSDILARRFVREAKITARLTHPGIPAVHQLGTLPDNSPFLAMKLIRGRTLSDELKDRPSTEHNLPHFEQVFEQLCQSVGYAHSEEVIHRDLKPANVMVGAFGEVQVMDWGLARDNRAPDSSIRTESDPTTDAEQAPTVSVSPTPRPDQTHIGSILGTPAYMAPEQARGEVVDCRADVFSLGAVLCEILTGKPPFTGNSTSEILKRAARGELKDAFKRLAECKADGELVELAKRCLNPDPERRPADGKAVAEAMAVYRAGVEERLRTAETERAAAEAKAIEETNTRREAEARVLEQRKKRRVQLALATTVGLLLIGVGVFAWWENKRETQRAAEAFQQQIDDEKRASAERDRLSRNASVIDERLTRCEESLRNEEALPAEDALIDAERRMPEGGGEAFRDRLARCRAELDMLKELNRTESSRWTTQLEYTPRPEDRAPADKPDAFTQLASKKTVSPVSDQQLIENWLKAFRAFGIVPGETPPAVALDRVKNSLVKEKLLAALDWWHAVDFPRHAELQAILTAADPDSYRDEVRSAMWVPDKITLRDLADRDEALHQPPRFAAVLGRIAAFPDNRRREILLRASLSSPRNLAVLMTAGALPASNSPMDSAEREMWYRAAVTAHPQSIAAWNNLGIVLSMKNDHEGAIACFNKAIELGPGNAMLRYNLGNELLAEKEFDRAISAFTKALELEPKYTTAALNLAIALSDKGDRDAALIAFDRVIAIEPTLALAHYNRGLLLLRMGRLDEAIAAFKLTTEHDPTFASAYLLLGVAFGQNKDPDGALAATRMAVLIDPKFVPAYLSVGHILMDKKNFKDAAVYFRKALQLDPGNSTAKTNLSNALNLLASELFGVRHFAEAETALRELLTLHPNDPLTHNDLGFVLLEQKKFTEAVSYLRKARALQPRNDLIRRNLAHALLQFGLELCGKQEFAKAVPVFKELVELEPKSVEARGNLGYALLLKGDTDEAIRVLREAVALDRKAARVRYMLGEALMAKEDWPGAIDAFKTVIELDSKFLDAHNGLGRALAEKGDLDGAVKVFKTAIEFAPKVAVFHNNLGSVLVRKEDWDGAIAAYQQALKLDPNFELAQTNLAHAEKGKAGFVAPPPRPIKR